MRKHRYRLPLIKGVWRDVSSDIKAGANMRYPWWCLLSIFIGAIIGAWLFDLAGRDDLALPILAFILALGTTIAVKWQMRWRPWFWTAMAIFTVLQIPLIAFVPWPKEMPPGRAFAGLATLEAIAMLAAVDAVARLTGRDRITG